jgi:hypothetical protein
MSLKIEMSDELLTYETVTQRWGASPALPAFRWMDGVTAEGYVPAWVTLETVTFWSTPFVSDTRDVTMHCHRVTAIPDTCIKNMGPRLPLEATTHVYHVEPIRLTVKEVLALLVQQPPDALVYLEGCDCIDTMDGLTYNTKEHSVLLTRTNSDTLHGS